MRYQSQDLATFPNQIGFALDHYESHGFRSADINGVLIGGLGGSGIAGRIVASLFASRADKPVEVVSDYDLPGWVDENTLVIASSYSGNTEETLCMYNEARKRKCPVIAITTGGKLGDFAIQNGDVLYKAEKGFQPRMALGYSFTYLIRIFEELFGITFIESPDDLKKRFEHKDHYMQKARTIYNSFKEGLMHKFVVIADGSTYSTGLRFCQQIQENAKGEAFIHELPEANHNVIESYYSQLNSAFIILNGNKHERTSLRFEFIEQLLTKHKNLTYNISYDGNNLQATMDTIYTLDWFSLMVSDHKGVNSVQIPNIEGLKAYLSER